MLTLYRLHWQGDGEEGMLEFKFTSLPVCILYIHVDVDAICVSIHTCTPISIAEDYYTCRYRQALLWHYVDKNYILGTTYVLQ